MKRITNMAMLAMLTVTAVFAVGCKERMVMAPNPHPPIFCPGPNRPNNPLPPFNPNKPPLVNVNKKPGLHVMQPQPTRYYAPGSLRVHPAHPMLDPNPRFKVVGHGQPKKQPPHVMMPPPNNNTVMFGAMRPAQPVNPVLQPANGVLAQPGGNARGPVVKNWKNRFAP